MDMKIELMKTGESKSSTEENWEQNSELDSNTSKPPAKEFNSADNSLSAQFAVNASWLVNWFLLGAKIYCTVTTSSKAVTAALADSAVDLVSQGVLALSDYYVSKHSPDYPVGRSRLEALSVIACAFIMSMASVEVIQFAIVDLFDGFEGNLPYLNVELDMYLILGIGTFLKFFLWIYCSAVGKRLKSDMIHALAEDHLNDVWSNSAAILTASIAYNTVAWYLDPLGAIVISVLIIGRWISVINEQIKKIVGYTAPPEYIKEIEQLAHEHDDQLIVDCTRVYHFGSRFNVEMEIVLPGDMTVRESHDIALALQHKIEGLEDVERAFVHVDHCKRDGLEHKIERELVTNSTSNSAKETDSLITASSVSNTTFNELRSRFGGSSGKSEKTSATTGAATDMESGDQL